MSRWAGTPRVELVTTDGFLMPNAELKRRGLMERKGFPESYDRRALLRFLTRVKSGVEEVRAPFYSHLRYDIVSDAQVVVRQPDVLIVEGFNVLQPPSRDARLAVSDLFDCRHLRRRSDVGHRALVRGAVPPAAAGGVRRPELVLPPLRDAVGG